MTDAFQFFIACFNQLLGLLQSVTFEMYGLNVDLLSVLIVFLLLGMIIAVFWKGARA